MVQLGEILIDVSGRKLAKINGLAVEEQGSFYNKVNRKKFKYSNGNVIVG